VINYLGSWGGGEVLPKAAMTAVMDRTIDTLQHRLAGETEQNLALVMHFPTKWDPYFEDAMRGFSMCTTTAHNISTTTASS